jgi:hypothetical protein
MRGKFKRRQSAAAAQAQTRTMVNVQASTEVLALALGEIESLFGKPAPKERLPTLQRTGKALGFRVWSLDGYRLLSANAAMKAYWDIGVNEAVCHFAQYQSLGYLAQRRGAPAGHSAPHPDCECGLYAYYDVPIPQSLSLNSLVYGHLGRTDRVYGAVTAWGPIEAHATGFRARYAEPVMLAYHPEQPYQHVIRVQALASEMGVECVELSELAQRAACFGEPIAPDLRPAPGPSSLWDALNQASTARTAGAMSYAQALAYYQQASPP